MQKLDKWLTMLFLHLCDYLIVNSQNTKKAVSALGIGDSKITILYPAVGVKPNVTASKRHLPKKPFRLLYVGYFEYRKGFDLLLQALTHLPQESFILTAVGDESIDPVYAKKMRLLGNELGLDVEYLGRVAPEQLSLLYAENDLLVCPSRLEGFGMAMIEAQAHGLPVVAFRVGAIAEAVVHEKGGLLVQPFNTLAFASAIESLVHDNAFWHQQSEYARQQGSQFLGWERLGNETYSLMKKHRLL